MLDLFYIYIGYDLVVLDLKLENIRSDYGLKRQSPFHIRNVCNNITHMYICFKYIRALDHYLQKDLLIYD